MPIPIDDEEESLESRRRKETVGKLRVYLDSLNKLTGREKQKIMILVDEIEAANIRETMSVVSSRPRPHSGY